MAVTTHSLKYKPTTAPSGTEDRVLACSHTTDACHCVINSSGHIGYYVSGVFTQIGTATVSLNEQYAFIIEHDDSGNGCIYLNGQKIGCATNFPTTAINQVGNFKTELKPETGRKPKVGLKPRTVSNIYARPCCGVIDEYARFNRALSASEVVDLSQSGTLSKVYTLADYKIALMADDGIIATTEKPRYKENWRSIWNADQRTSALPTAIASITVNGSYKSLATSANDAGIWTPTTNGTPAYDYYQAVESWRKMYFVSSGGGTGFLLTANLAGDTDISAMSPTLEARQSALMFAEDALRSAVMIKRQSTAELTSVANANAYTDELEDALREQTDHAIVFTTSASDPSTSWTAEEKLIHKGDYWRADPSSAWKTWTSTTWGTVNDAQAQAAATAAASAASTAQSYANAAQATANEKRRVFNSTPTVPYDIGDLWVAGSSGDIKNCNTQRLTGSYTASDWSIASKYTDDSTANQKSRTFIQTTAPTSGVNAGDYWLDSDDGHKPYVYKDGAWSVDSAMQSAINAGTAASNAQAAANFAQSVANGKTTLYGTLASAKLAAKSGDQFFYNSEIYVCTADLAATARRYTTKSYGNSATAPVQTTQTVSGCVLTEPLNYGDTYFNTTTKKFYTYTTSWVEDTATGNLVIAYAPKYLGRYYQSHPGAPNNGDWWLVYGLASSPITRGFWYNNNGTPTLITTLTEEAQRKYKGSGLEDVLYASNNGYALTSGGVYDPVGIYGVSTMEFLAVNQAFVQKLMVQEMQFQNSISSVESSDFEIGDNRVYMGKDSANIFSLLFQSLVGKTATAKFWSDVFRLYGSLSNAEMELQGNSYVNGKSFSGYSSVWRNYTPYPESSFPTTGAYGSQASVGIACTSKWGVILLRNNYTTTFRLYASGDNGKSFPVTETKTYVVSGNTMVTCAKQFGNFVYVGTTTGLFMISYTNNIASSVMYNRTSAISGAVLSLQIWNGRLIVSTTTGSYYFLPTATQTTSPTVISSSARTCAVDTDTQDAFFSLGYVTDQGSSTHLAPYIYRYNGTNITLINALNKPITTISRGTQYLAMIGCIGIANNILFAMITDTTTAMYLVKSVDLGLSWEEVSVPADGVPMYFANISCYDRVLVLRKSFGMTYYSTDFGVTWVQIGEKDASHNEAKASTPDYTLINGARRLYIATPDANGNYSYTETHDQQLGNVYEETSPIKYFEFPSGTAHSTIYNVISTYINPAVNSYVSTMGTYTMEVCKIHRNATTNIVFTNIGDTMILSVSPTQTTTYTTARLQVAFIVTT